jgi:hypothetical protein
MLKNVIVLKPQNSNPHIRKHIRASLIVRQPLGVKMLPAIRFDAEHRFHAEEVQYVSGDRMLSAEFEPAEPSVTEDVPELQLRVSRLAPHFASKNF